MGWVPGSPWTSKWQFSLSVYISCSPDCQDLVSSLMEDYVPLWQKQCIDGGCSLTPCHFQPSALAQYPVNTDYMMSVCSTECDRSNIFVCFLKEKNSQSLKLEVEHGHLNNPLARPSVFLLIPSSMRSKSAGDGGGGGEVLECVEDGSESLQWVSEQIQTILRKEFSVGGVVEGDSEEVMGRMGQLEDMRAEWHQRKTLEHYVHRAPPELFGVETVYDRLEEYMREEGPVLPLLLTGHPGLGKSTLLAKWIDRMERGGSKTNLILYHFVSCLGSSSAEPGVIFGRLLKKIRYVCGEASSLPTVPSQLMESFTDSLERLSVAKVEEGGMAVIVIDGADLIKECEQSLYWLLQPLPQNIRVVLSANEENYPDSWRALPSPSIPTPTAQEMQDIVEYMVAGRDSLNLEQVGALAVEGPAIPLWGVLATQHALSVSAATSEEMDAIIDTLVTEQEVEDLTCLILRELEESYPWMARSIEQVLKVIYWSRNGVLFGELLDITGLADTLLRLTVCELQRRSILQTCGGLLQLTHHDRSGCCSTQVTVTCRPVKVCCSGLSNSLPTISSLQ
ncbi:Nephrocystin-3 [Geodia barretti]|uniref:Nephrocystin-3 n=1 Tax=Geodia barretti TaxID=519541 RepID=A0AA35SV23_GEOBA|nr:Nephrocystin-3 [Geodia barretti]